MMAEPRRFDAHFNILLIGDSGVGKTSVLLRYTNDSFARTLITTTAVDFKIKNINLDGRKIKLQIWDTPGQDRFRTITTSYFRVPQGYLVGFDTTDRTTFTNVRQWMAEVKSRGVIDADAVIFGTKCDMTSHRVVGVDEAEALAREFNVRYFEVSAAQDKNINDMFVYLAAMLKHRIFDPELHRVISPVSQYPPRSWLRWPQRKAGWTPDAKLCEGCHKTQFSILRRRHHCRRCWKCLCSSCIPLNCTTRLPEYKVPVIVCRACCQELGFQSTMNSALNLGCEEDYVADGRQYICSLPSMVLHRSEPNEFENWDCGSSAYFLLRGRFHETKVIVKQYKQTYKETRAVAAGSIYQTPPPDQSFAMEVHILKALNHEMVPIVKLVVNRAMASTQHPFIAVGCGDGTSMNLMYVLKSFETGWPWKLSVLRDIASVLVELHRMNISHFDVAASSCVVNDERGLINGKVKVFDFSACVSFGQMNSEKLHSLEHSLARTPPEVIRILQLKGQHAAQAMYTLNYSYDMFSFGMLMAEVGMGQDLTFTDPSAVRTVRQLSAARAEGDLPLLHSTSSRKLPAGFEQLAKRCWVDLPDSRPTAQDMVNTLSRMINAHVIREHYENVSEQMEGAEPFKLFKSYHLSAAVLPPDLVTGLYSVPRHCSLFQHVLRISQMAGGKWLNEAKLPLKGFILRAVEAIVARPGDISAFESRIRRLSSARESSGEYFNFDTSSFSPEQMDVLNVLRNEFHPHAPDSNPTDAHIIHVFHGPRRQHVESICTVGLVATRTKDAGFFGSPGLYSTFNIEYAARYAFGDFDDPDKLRPPAEDGLYPVIMFAAAVGMAYPVTPTHDYEIDPITNARAERSNYFGKPLRPGFDTHVICVNAASNYQAVTRQECEYVEIVMDQEAQLLPLAVLWFGKC